MAYSTAFSLTTGRLPGRPRSTGVIWVFGPTSCGGARSGRVGRVAEHLRLGAQLDVHFETEHRLEELERLVVVHEGGLGHCLGFYRRWVGAVAARA